MLDKAQNWFDQGLLSRQELNILRNQELGFTTESVRNPCLTTTNEYLRRVISNQSTSKKKYGSCLSVSYQEEITQAVNEFEVQFANRLSLQGFNLYSAAIVVDVSTGHIIGHYGGKGVTDLASYGTGYPIGSIIKPFLLLELLEQGWAFDNVRLYDGKMRDRLTPNNFSGSYSDQYVGINTILGKSLNTIVNIRALVNPIDLYRTVEAKYTEMGISHDPYIDLSDKNRYGEYEVNYPLGSRNMTLLDVAQMYQTLFNSGKYHELKVLTSFTDPLSGKIVSLSSKNRQVYQSINADAIKTALQNTMKSGGTGTHLIHLLPQGKTYYAKTGTTDKARHGYTVLSDGKTLIVSWVSYCKETNNLLGCNDSPQIPFGSGSRSAGILAALIYNHLQ